MTSEASDFASLKEQHRVEKREHIARAAASVFARQGFAETSVGDVARAAGISPASLYTYFGSREELLFIATFLEIGELEARMRLALGAEGPADAAVRRMVDAYWSFYRDRPQGFRMLMAGLDRAARAKVPGELVAEYDRRALECLTLLRDVVDRGSREGTFRAGDSWELTHVIWGAIHGILGLAARQDPERFVGFAVKDLVDRTVDALLDGIREER
ncbi:MAG TPA: TetR/AcrR family transcriptional regulator [Thermoleophilaceae bacterium]|nr:TetR/AcrR family transcriptional regulator [Thermoleophilaceae bacterium]